MTAQQWMSDAGFNSVPESSLFGLGRKLATHSRRHTTPCTTCLGAFLRAQDAENVVSNQ